MNDPVYVKDLEDRFRHTKAALEKAVEQLKLHSGDTASLSSELRNLREQYDESHDQRHAEARKADAAIAALEAMRKERDDYKLDADTRVGTINAMRARLSELQGADDDLDEAETERDAAVANAAQWKERAEKAEAKIAQAAAIDSHNACGLAPDGDGCNTMAELRQAKADTEKYKSELERHIRMLSECAKERDALKARKVKLPTFRMHDDHYGKVVIVEEVESAIRDAGVEVES